MTNDNKLILGSALLSSVFYLTYISGGLDLSISSLMGFFYCGIGGVCGVRLLIEAIVGKEYDK